MQTRDIVVLGGSAGALEPLRRIVSDLPETLPASIFVVLHMSPRQPSALAEILGRAGPLRAAPASDGEPIERGRIYVAPPDFHLQLDVGRVRVVHGPPENRNRPSIDVLFRSAARRYGPRVTGVVLSGALDDGAAGLIAVKIRGGMAVVQDPAEAFSADMPRNAMRYLEVDRVARAAEIGGILDRLVREAVEPDGVEPPNNDMVEETRIARLDPEAFEREERPGTQSEFACPDCDGVLWEIQEGDLLRFRCRTGHAYSPETLIAAQDEGIEEALYVALRAIEERLALRHRLIDQVRSRNLKRLADEWESGASELDNASRAIRGLLAARKKPAGSSAPR